MAIAAAHLRQLCPLSSLNDTLARFAESVLDEPESCFDVSAVIPTILRDSLPRQLAYSVSGATLARELGFAEGLEDMGLFYLFTSGVQVDYYDPIVSRAQCYPVLALDHYMPQLTSNALEMLRKKTGRGPLGGHVRGGEWFTMRLRGAARAQAQFLGQSMAELEEVENKDGELELCDVSICVFPVKSRLRKRVSRLILETAIRPIRNWLGAPPERRETQRPLVILYDELEGAVSTKFCEEWPDVDVPRHSR